MAMPSEAATIVESFLIANIRRDREVQVRKALDLKAVEEYRDRILGGEMPPAVRVFHDGTDYWLSRGFHRVEAMLQADGERIDAEVKQGTRRDAILDCLGANRDNGVRLTKEEKRLGVARLLADEVWSKWSNAEVARRAGVSEALVRSMLEDASLTSHVRSDVANGRKHYVDRHGKETTMRTGAIGKASRLRVVREEDAPAVSAPASAPERPLADELSQGAVAARPVASPDLASPDVPAAQPEVAASPVGVAPQPASPALPAPKRRKSTGPVAPESELSRQALAGKVRRYHNAHKDAEKEIKEALKLLNGGPALQIRLVEIEMFLHNALKRLKEVH